MIQSPLLAPSQVPADQQTVHKVSVRIIATTSNTLDLSTLPMFFISLGTPFLTEKMLAVIKLILFLLRLLLLMPLLLLLPVPLPILLLFLLLQIKIILNWKICHILILTGDNKYFIGPFKLRLTIALSFYRSINSGFHEICSI